MVKSGLADLLEADIQDPTDFPADDNAPGLRSLDAALRCKICSELYDAPVILPCGHTFCSLCARQQLLDKPSCPTCWKETSEGALKTNPMLEEAVEAWKRSRQVTKIIPVTYLSPTSRPYVLQLSTEDVERRSRPSRPPPSFDSRSAKKRKTSNDASDSEAGPSRSRIINKRSRSSSAQLSAVDEDEEDEPRGSSVVELSPDELVPCPVCTKPTRIADMDAHIGNGCKTTSLKPTTKPATKQSDAWSKIFDGGNGKGKTKKRSDNDDDYLPKVSYNMLKDKQIRDLLAEQELPTTGDHTTLVARHQRWVSIYNANVDRNPQYRRRISELRAELRKWEKEREAGLKKSSSKEAAMQVNVKEYRRANKAEFDQLVAQARPKSNAGGPSRSNSAPLSRQGSDASQPISVE
ncbi:hypothetical protein PENSPDRAFT_579153 [Peniophora sp. CONT]|nr:hypothetical protein PENSPDRAFT_579153 [Peniophora sp. CONT]